MSEALDLAQEEVKPDMTPMIDVVFLMIIFFICIDFKVLESKLPAFLPKDKGSSTDIVAPKEQLSLKIHVESAGLEIGQQHRIVGDNRADRSQGLFQRRDRVRDCEPAPRRSSFRYRR